MLSCIWDQNVFCLNVVLVLVAWLLNLPSNRNMQFRVYWGNSTCYDGTLRQKLQITLAI